MEQSSEREAPPGPVNDAVDDELMAMFKEIAVNDKKVLVQYLADKNWGELRSKAHEVKGYGASFGYPLISEKAEALQNAIDQEQVEQAPELAAVLISEMEVVLP